METSQDDCTEETNIIQTQTQAQILPYKNDIALTDPSARPYRIEFVKVQAKILQDNLDNLDIDFDSMTGTDIDNLISTEKETKMNDEDLINYLIYNDYQDNNDTNTSTKQEDEKIIKLTLNKRMELYLKNKVKKLETIQERINEEKTKDLSFTPMINRIGKTKMRTFEEFIKAQKEHLRKVYEKILQLKQKNTEQENELNPNKPRIDAQSEKLAAKRFQTLNDSNDVYGRLYSLRSQSPSMKELLNRSANTSMISKCQLSKEQEEYYDNLYQDAQKRKDKVKLKEDQLREELRLNQPKSNLSSNKILFDKFQVKFKREINTLLSNNLSIKRLINKNQLTTLMSQLNFISIQSNNNDNNNNSPNEKRLVDIIFESLINANVSNNSISIEHLYIFCLSIIGLLEYYILSAYEGNNLSFISNSSSSQNQSFLLKKINEDLANKIQRPKQYGGFDSEDNYIITINQGKTIFRDFKLLFLNWKTYLNSTLSKGRQYSKEHQITQITPPLRHTTTTPQLKHNKSMKALTEINKDNSLFTHIHQSLLRKREMEKIIMKRNNDKRNQEMENCTFKPKINKHSFYSDNIVPCDRMTESTQEQLHKRESLIQLVQSDRKKNDIEYENNRSECTFKPVINQRITKYPSPKIQTDENEKYAERMKKGRIEREYKAGALNLRSGPIGGYINNINQSSTQNKEIKRTSSNRSIEKDLVKLQFTKSNDNNQMINKEIVSTTQPKEEMRQLSRVCDSKKTPLMAIDIKLKDGIKKQIYVYEGNTPDQLAKQFSEENNIDFKKQIKLKFLIEKELEKFFTLKSTKS